jgi:hypothetical protein
MSISNAHSEAARQNGKLSQGPVTPSGKERSSQNARKHNLLGSTALLSCEDKAELDALTEGFLAEYKPETPTESRFVREMVDAEFRLQRVRSHSVSIQEARMRKISETPTMDDAAEAFRQLAGEGPSLSLLLRYENQFRRQFEKSLQMLLDFRLRERTDKEKILKARVDADNHFAEPSVGQPEPGEPAAPVQSVPPAPSEQPDAASATAAKSNTLSFPKEPSDPDSPAAQPAKITDGPFFGQYFGNLAR